ncbi:hypothetical protein BH20CHL6_BH20CHL6_09450 [soil metagenome]
MLGPWLTAVWVAAVLAIGAWLAWRASGPRDRPLDAASPGRLFVVFHVLLIGAGGVALTASGESGGAGPLLGAYALVAFGIGATLAARRWGVPRSLGPPVTDRPVQPWAVLALVVVGLGAVAIIASRNGVPFATADPQATRLAFGGPIFDLFRWFVPPAALIALSVALARSGRQAWAVAALAIGGVVLLELSLASRVLPLELTVAGLLITWWAGRRMPRRGWIALAAAALLLFVGVQLARIGPRGGFSGPADVAGFVVERTASRVFLIQPRTIDHLVASIPADEPFFAGGTYVRRLATLTGADPPPSLGRWIFDRLYPGQVDQGFITPGILGEAWANFGPFALLGMALLGVFAQWLSRFVAALGPGPADRVFAALLVLALARTYATSLNGFLATLAAILVWRLVVTFPDRPDWLRRARLSATHSPGE